MPGKSGSHIDQRPLDAVEQAAQVERCTQGKRDNAGPTQHHAGAYLFLPGAAPDLPGPVPDKPGVRPISPGVIPNRRSCARQTRSCTRQTRSHTRQTRSRVRRVRSCAGLAVRVPWYARNISPLCNINLRLPVTSGVESGIARMPPAPMTSLQGGVTHLNTTHALSVPGQLTRFQKRSIQSILAKHFKAAFIQGNSGIALRYRYCECRTLYNRYQVRCMHFETLSGPLFDLVNKAAYRLKDACHQTVIRRILAARTSILLCGATSKVSSPRARYYAAGGSCPDTKWRIEYLPGFGTASPLADTGNGYVSGQDLHGPPVR